LDSIVDARLRLKCPLLLASLLGAMFVHNVARAAVDEGLIFKDDTSLLQPYEPLTGGYTKDSNDAGNLDVDLSLKFRLLPVDAFGTTFGQDNRFYFTMATRFGFYWGSRSNSPVIGKRFNPQLLWRFSPKAAEDGKWKFRKYVDVGYAHESTGQLVHTLEQYQEQLVLTPNPQEANQYVHRGWDYVHLALKLDAFNNAGAYFDGKYFLPNGLLQGPEDQYHPWENNPEGKRREAVDGLEVAFEYPTRNIDSPVVPDRAFGTLSLSLKYSTGYDLPFRYSTERAEVGFQLGSLPMAIWVQHGYMSSARVYERPGPVL
jgi:hypothetical protein